MKIEKMEVVGINVKNLDDAVKQFSDPFRVTFVRPYEKLETGEIKRRKTVTEHANQYFEERKIKTAIDRSGFFELLESNPPLDKEGLRNIHFKVSDIEQAVAELRSKGVRLMVDVKIGSLRECIFNPDDLHGVRLCLIEYSEPSLAEAIMKSPD